MNTRWIAAPIIALTLVGGAAAQDEQPAAQPAAAPRPEPKLIDPPETNATYSDDEIAKAAEMLIGTWITSSPVNEINGEGQSNIVMTIGPALVSGNENILYCEIAREDGIATPYRQSFFQFYRFKGELRLRTYDIRSEQASKALLGMALLPVMFPQTITAADMYPTIDIDLKTSGAGYAGQSPAPYPDHRGGAVQMTSSIAFDGQTISVTDIGYGAEGDVAWEVGRDGGVEFERTDSLVEIDYYDDRLIVVHFAEPEGEPIKDGDWMVIHYLGRLTDGTKFDASFDRGEPFRYKYPATNLVQGWNRGTVGMTKGSRRRIVIPPALGWGERAMGPIPPNSTVIFDVECVFIEEDTAGPAPTTEPAQPADQPEADEGE